MFERILGGIVTVDGFKFEYKVYSDRWGDIYKQIILDIKQERYFLLYENEESLGEIDITTKVDKFCKDLQKININEWNQKCFDEPWEFFPNFYWKLSISADDIYVDCKGMDNFPDNWNAFKMLLHEIGLVDFGFPL